MSKLARVMLLMIVVWLLIKRATRVLLIRLHWVHHSVNIIVISLELVVVMVGMVLVLTRHQIRMIPSLIVRRHLISVVSLHCWLVNVASHLLLLIVVMLIRESLRPCTCSFFFNINIITPFSFSPLLLTAFLFFIIEVVSLI